jgi:hypothetical protein
VIGKQVVERGTRVALQDGKAGDIAFAVERRAEVDNRGTRLLHPRLPSLHSRLGLLGRGVRQLLASRDRRAIEHEELRHRGSFRDPLFNSATVYDINIAPVWRSSTRSPAKRTDVVPVRHVT